MVHSSSKKWNDASRTGRSISVTPLFGVELSPVTLRHAGEIERAVNAFARGPNGVLVVTDGGPSKFIMI
jgi:hypothetical protein